MFLFVGGVCWWLVISYHSVATQRTVLTAFTANNKTCKVVFR
jgi:hypothetical protein